MQDLGWQNPALVVEAEAPRNSRPKVERLEVQYCVGDYVVKIVEQDMKKKKVKLRHRSLLGGSLQNRIVVDDGVDDVDYEYCRECP